MKILAIDVGKKRIGLATCDPLEIAASPYSIIKSGKKAVNEVVKIIEKENIELVVVGLPVSFDGKEREACTIARFFKNQLAAVSKVEIDFFDERFTSKIAENSLIQSGMNSRQRKGKIDDVAASIILQGYLQARKNRSSAP
ncbi:MAG: Holliday junction resolvase RuvX [Candidatus Rifleibacteriota bacterium]